MFLDEYFLLKKLQKEQLDFFIFESFDKKLMKHIISLHLINL